MQTIQQFMPLIVILLVLLGGFFSWLSKTLQEQAATKRARERQEQAEREALRTGRTSEQAPEPVTPAAEAPSAQRRLQELAERRRRQLEELKARQAAKGNIPRPTPPRPRPAPAVSRTVAATPIPQERTSSSDPAKQVELLRQDAQRRQDRQRAEVAARGEANRRQGVLEEAERHAAELQARERERLAVAKRAAEANVESPTVRQAESAAKRAHPIRATIGRIGVADLRKAVILQEIVGPPLSARNSAGNSGVSW